jgi:aromatic ring-opening dioxygenase LigB subunit
MKTIVVQWDVDAYKEFTHLQEAVIEGQKSKKQPSYEQLLSSINNAIQNLKSNAFYGDLIPRKYLSKKIIDKYGTDKIFRIELVGYWRLLYTVVGDEAQIIAFILEYMDHPSYDKLFGYRKK